MSRMFLCCSSKSKKDLISGSGGDFTFLMSDTSNSKDYKEDPNMKVLKARITRLMKQKPIKKEHHDKSL